MTREEFEQWLKNRAKEMPHGFQANLARQLGVTRAHISQVFNKKTKPSYDTLFELVDALGYELVLKKKNDPEEP